MAITRESLRLAEELRVAVNTELDTATRQLVQGWVRAWEDIRAEVEAAIEELLAAGDGRWPTQAQIRRAARAERALRLAELALRRLAEMGAVTVTSHAGTAVDLGARGQPRLIASQLPQGYGIVANQFDLVSPDALHAIVTRSAEQIASLTRPLSGDAMAVMRAALIRGVAVGNNPRTAAREMMRRLQGGFNGGLTRAMVIARTEMLDAHRQGAAAQQNANSEVMAGWRWLAQLDSRTCPSCWSQHGKLHNLGKAGPLDHQQGRCARMPVTKSWRQLGFAIDEPPSEFPDARARFDGLPEADQVRIMGPRRLELLRSGRVGWDDLSRRRHTRGWRDSHTVAPLGDLERRAAA